MKENSNIDEVLNSFIDGELTQRQRVEVQRLIAHDAQIAKRLAELQKCKMLVGSLPCAEAPAGMAEEIKASLERRALLGQQLQRPNQREGARHLLVRKVLATAAMIGLFAILGAVIYTIVAPQSVTEKPIAIEDWRKPARKVEVAELKPSTVATAEKLFAEASQPLPATSGEMEFKGRLELKTSALIAVDAFINRAIEDNGLLDYLSPKAEGDKNTYALSCSREALSLLLADLDSVWARFDSATLFVETETIGGQVVISGVSAEQIVEIANQASLERCIGVAKDFAVLNSMAELLPGREILAAIDDRRPNLITIPKPVLTSSEKTVKKPASRAEKEEQVHLTIVVTGSE